MSSGWPTKLQKRPDALEEFGESLWVCARSDNVGNRFGRSGCNCINVVKGEATGLGKTDLFDDLIEFGLDPFCMTVQVGGDYPRNCTRKGHPPTALGDGLDAQENAVLAEKTPEIRRHSQLYYRRPFSAHRLSTSPLNFLVDYELRQL